MTVGMLVQILKDNHIPEGTMLMSDSGWECDATDINGVMYSRDKNTIVFTQGSNEGSHVYPKEDG